MGQRMKYFIRSDGVYAESPTARPGWIEVTRRPSDLHTWDGFYWTEGPPPPPPSGAALAARIEAALRAKIRAGVIVDGAPYAPAMIDYARMAKIRGGAGGNPNKPETFWVGTGESRRKMVGVKRLTVVAIDDAYADYLDALRDTAATAIAEETQPASIKWPPVPTLTTM